MHIQLDPVGGIAGDMFAAAVLDAWPDREAALIEDLSRCDFDRIFGIARIDHADHALTGSRFEVKKAAPEHEHAHRSGSDGDRHHHDPHHPHHRYRDIRDLLRRADLDAKTKDRALDILSRLALAESSVHGMPVEEVGFHEVGAFDSIADIVSAAWLIERLDASWSCAALPLGSGRVQSAHGLLPIPAPATVELLKGMPVVQDAHRGERITPTGAAIIAHLAPDFSPLHAEMRLLRSGIGFGTAVLPGMSNILRLLAFAPLDRNHGEHHAGRHERIAVHEFEVDDQSGEDLAVALDRLRAIEGVLDVSCHAMQGKKARISIHIRLLSRIDAVDEVLAGCFEQTTTLGVRWYEVNRRVLARTQNKVDAADRSIRIKKAVRPGGISTVKAEIDDLAQTPGGHAHREGLRREVEGEGYES
ncbi:LarC family nickel insertion protein [Thioalkalivibrio sp. HK1]|uniref:LarC family nickel insertion protein n=1 Tax=Thioalkalivibrio sp. HK1 TaxID=1469245 RepID=UPI00047111C0|nr:LarC family nickel insertion protein [Thioalkalivibrio sp. HK1]